MSVIPDFLAQYGPGTARVYRSALVEFERLTGSTVEQATQGDALRYQAALDGLAPATVERKLATLSAIARYMQARGIRSDNPLTGIRADLYRVDRASRIKYLDPPAVAKLMAEAMKDRRDAALVAVLLHGLRISEAVGLSVEQVRDGALVAIVGKGGKVRTVPLRETAQRILAEYIGARRSGPLFLNQSRQRLGVRRATDLIYSVAGRAGMRISPHQLRHTMATMSLRAGVGLAHLQDLLGHASPTTTRVYSKLGSQELASAVASVDLLAEGGRASTHPLGMNPAPTESYGLTLIRGGRDETPPSHRRVQP